MAICGPEVFGADPLNIKWTVVRGDTATLKIEFYENDETTYYDTEGWQYVASVYSPKEDMIDELETQSGEGYVEIIASPDITKNWGTGYSTGSIAEFLFDLQVTYNGTIWTPVIGTVNILGDVTYGGL